MKYHIHSPCPLHSTTLHSHNPILTLGKWNNAYTYNGKCGEWECDRERVIYIQHEASEAESTAEVAGSRAGTLLLFRLGTIFVAWSLLLEASGTRPAYISSTLLVFWAWLWDCEWFTARRFLSEEAGSKLWPLQGLQSFWIEVTQHSCQFSSPRSAIASSSVSTANAETLSPSVDRGRSTRSSASTASINVFCEWDPNYSWTISCSLKFAERQQH